MRVVETSELSNYKVLPFDLFTENKTKILEAGEILTPGKLIMLKNYVHIYAEDLSSTEEDENETSSANQEKSTHTKQRLFNFSYESLDPDDFETVINRESCFKLETQIKIKYFYKKILDLIPFHLLIKLLIHREVPFLFYQYHAAKRQESVRPLTAAEAPFFCL